MALGIYGDKHLDRSLPHTTTDKNGKDLRYEFFKKLLKTVLKPVDLSIHLGDWTHKKNYIDGKIAEDSYDMLKNKNSLHILGNHDASEDGDKYCSLVELLAKTIPGMMVVRDLYQFDYGIYKFVCTSYYADEEKIKKAVKTVINDTKGKKQIIVLGHWHFWNDLRNSGKRLLPFAKQTNSKYGVLWILGHEHSPNKIINNKKTLGYYLGCMNPVQFGERQGKVMMINNKNSKPQYFDYPFGEKFIIGSYTKEEKNLPEIKDPEKTYLRIITDDLSKTDEIKEIYEGINLRHFTIPFKPSEKTKKEKEFKVATKAKTEDDYMITACEANDLNPKEIMPYHNKVKEIAEAQ